MFKDVTGGWRLALGLMLLYGLILAGGMLCLPETPRYSYVGYTKSYKLVSFVLSSWRMYIVTRFRRPLLLT